MFLDNPLAEIFNNIGNGGGEPSGTSSLNEIMGGIGIDNNNDPIGSFAGILNSLLQNGNLPIVILPP